MMDKRSRGGQISHGCTNTREYRVWADMRQRCNNPKNSRYKNYGARGISICERWGDFANFLLDMGTRPTAEHSIDRINNDGNYEPSNCRWSTRSEQQKNKTPYPKNNKLPTGDVHWTRRDRTRARDLARKNMASIRRNGTDNSNAKLNHASAELMRLAFSANPTITMADLGRQFNVGRETARKIIRRVSWL